MLKIIITSQYKKDFKKAAKQEQSLEELKIVINNIAMKKSLPSHYNDHPLSGKLKNYRDCHIAPDFLLIYQVSGDELKLVRLGAHSELFKK